MVSVTSESRPGEAGQAPSGEQAWGSGAVQDPLAEWRGEGWGAEGRQRPAGRALWSEEPVGGRSQNHLRKLWGQTLGTVEAERSNRSRTRGVRKELGSWPRCGAKEREGWSGLTLKRAQRRRRRGKAVLRQDQHRACCPADGTKCSVSLQLVYPSDFRLTDKEVGPGPPGSSRGPDLSRPSPSFLCFRKAASATCPSLTPTQVGNPNWDVGTGGGGGERVTGKRWEIRLSGSPCGPGLGMTTASCPCQPESPLHKDPRAPHHSSGGQVPLISFFLFF